MDPREAPRDDRRAAEQARRQRGVLAAAAFTVVAVPNDDPPDRARAMSAGDHRDRPPLPGHRILRRPGRAAGRIVGPGEEIVAEALEVSPQPQPFAGRRDLVGGGLALRLDQERQSHEVASVPRRPRREALEALACRVDGDLHALARGGRRNVVAIGMNEAARRHVRRLRRRLEAEGLPVRPGERLGPRVEREPTGDAERRHDLRARDEAHRGDAPVVAAGEVAVIGRHDGVRLAPVAPSPLPDAGPAGTGEDHGACAHQRGELPIALDGGAHALGAGRHVQLRPRSEAARRRLCRDVRGACHVLVRRVRAAAQERRRDRVHEAVRRIPHLGRQRRERPRAVRGVRPDHVRLERGEVDVDHALVVGLGGLQHRGVRGEQAEVTLHDRCQRRAVGRAQVAQHALVGREQRRRRAELGAHVRDRGLSRGADARGARADVLDDRVRRTGNAEHAGDVQDDVLRRGPPAEAPAQANGDAARVEQLPGEPCDHLDRLGAADADRAGAEAAGVRCVRVGADDELAREGVGLEDHLVDDARARPPEACAVLRRRRAQEVVDLAVLVLRGAQVGEAVGARLHEVIAVDGGRHGEA